VKWKKLLRLHCIVLESLLANHTDQTWKQFVVTWEKSKTDWWRHFPGSWRPRRG